MRDLYTVKGQLAMVEGKIKSFILWLMKFWLACHVTISMLISWLALCYRCQFGRVSTQSKINPNPSLIYNIVLSLIPCYTTKIYYLLRPAIMTYHLNSQNTILIPLSEFLRTLQPSDFCHPTKYSCLEGLVTSLQYDTYQEIFYYASVSVFS